MDVGGALTRKLGPLPAWAWGGVLGVGVLAYRAVRGTGSKGGSSGSVQTIGGEGASLAPGASFDGSGGGGSGSGTPTSTVGGDTLPGVIGQVSSAFSVQQQLNDALQKVSLLIERRQTLISTIDRLRDQYNSGKLSKSSYTTQVNAATTQLQSVNTQIAQQNSLITTLKTQLTGLFAAPANA